MQMRMFAVNVYRFNLHHWLTIWTYEEEHQLRQWSDSIALFSLILGREHNYFIWASKNRWKFSSHWLGASCNTIRGRLSTKRRSTGFLVNELCLIPSQSIQLPPSLPSSCLLHYRVIIVVEMLVKREQMAGSSIVAASPFLFQRNVMPLLVIKYLECRGWWFFRNYSQRNLSPRRFFMQIKFG